MPAAITTTDPADTSWRLAHSLRDRKAARLVARTEGVFLDPVFAAKAMAGLIAAAGEGRVDAPAIFLVTGGAPTLFS